MATNRAPPTLKVYVGCMYSGKSTELIRQVHRLQATGMSVLVINHASDIRSDGITQHNGFGNTIDIVNLPLKDIPKLDLYKDCDAIAIEEGQFFGPEIVDFCITAVNHDSKSVVVAGLDGNFQQEKFGHLLELCPHADHFEKLRALCTRCRTGREAPYTIRLTSNKELVDIGGQDKYEAVCRECLLSQKVKYLSI